mmetsp:Transcript_46744/g.126121  ORF Transcript_46744/g.126121 Transcript_46744/m.126121 type:complete len:333 (-) Transcript_46744:669-1667(-)
MNRMKICLLSLSSPLSLARAAKTLARPSGLSSTGSSTFFAFAANFGLANGGGAVAGLASASSVAASWSPSAAFFSASSSGSFFSSLAASSLTAVSKKATKLSSLISPAPSGSKAAYRSSRLSSLAAWCCLMRVLAAARSTCSSAASFFSACSRKFFSRVWTRATREFILSRRTLDVFSSAVTKALISSRPPWAPLADARLARTPSTVALAFSIRASVSSARACISDTEAPLALPVSPFMWFSTLANSLSAPSTDFTASLAFSFTSSRSAFTFCSFSTRAFLRTASLSLSRATPMATRRNRKPSSCTPSESPLHLQMRSSAGSGSLKPNSALE